MLYIIHRVNEIKRLITIPAKFGVEIDVRGFGEKILLSHDPISSSREYDELEDYLKEFHHAFIIFNVKEAGYESQIIALARKYNIENYFLLDVEFPYLYNATRNMGVRKIAIRYSEAEPIEMAEAQIKNGQALVDWVWIDTNTQLPLNEDVVNRLAPFRTCLVCPERWGRPEDIMVYGEKIKQLNFKLDAIMTSEQHVSQWQKVFD